MVSLGDKIKTAIYENGLSQVNLANKLNVDSSTVSLWIKNKRMPRYEHLTRIAEITGKPIEYFMESIEGEKKDKIQKNLAMNPNQTMYNANIMDYKLVPIRVVGEVKAGTITYQNDLGGDNEYILYPLELLMNVPMNKQITAEDYIILNKRFGIVKVKGDSMSPRIMEGDFVIFDAFQQPRNGDIVIYSSNEGIVCKYYHIKNNEVRLVSENIEYQDIIIDRANESEYFYHGIVLSTIKSFL